MLNYMESGSGTNLSYANKKYGTSLLPDKLRRQITYNPFSF